MGPLLYTGIKRASFQAAGTHPSVKLPLKRSQRHTDLPLAHKDSSFGGTSSKPGAFPHFRPDRVSKTSAGVVENESGVMRTPYW